MNDSAVRSLFGKPGSGNTISMSDGWGKSAISITVPALGVYATAYPGDTAYGELIFNSNGTISYGSSNMGTGNAGSWATPTTTGIGSSYWVRFTQTGSYGTGGFGGAVQYGSAKGVWHQISSIPYFGVSRTGNGIGGFYYTVQIASDSGGSNILATRTDVEVAAEIIF
jgi:maltose-binding protein MalE